MKSAILLLCFSGLVMGYDETCEAKGESCVAPDDVVELMQTRTQVHKHKHSRMTNTDMQEVLISFEEREGPAALQELMQVLMVLPVLKSEGNMLALHAAVQAQPQLQQLAKRYPDFMHTLGVFEDPKAIPQIKAALFTLKAHQPSAIAQERPSLTKMLGQAQGHQLSRDTTLLGLFQGPSAILAWVESWGCTSTLGFTDFPDASMGINSESIFGPDCKGNPWISNLGVRAKDNGAAFVFGNYSTETSETSYSLAFVGENGYTFLGSLGSSVSASAFGVDALYYIKESGKWPNQTYHLMSAQEGGTNELVNIPSCLYPSQMKSVPGSDTMIWQCSKDWSNQNSSYKIMKYSVAGTPEILVESKDYFGHVSLTGSQLYYSMYEKNGNSSESHYAVYSCPIAKCDPVKVGALPKGAYDFIVTESGELITTGWTSWKVSSSKGSESWTAYNVSVSSQDDYSYTTMLFSIGGTSHLQLVATPPTVEVYDPPPPPAAPPAGGVAPCSSSNNSFPTAAPPSIPAAPAVPVPAAPNGPNGSNGTNGSNGFAGGR